MYKKASQIKLRFATERGNLSVEDLWNLGLDELDSLAQRCEEEAVRSEKSFIKKVSVDEKATLRFDIIKDVIETCLARIEAQASAVERKKRKSQILDIMARKQDASLEEATLEDLQAMLAEL